MSQQIDLVEKYMTKDELAQAGKDALGTSENLQEKPLLIQASDIEQKTPTFLFNGMPDNNIVVLAGDGGVGKSLLECNLAAAVTTGKASIFDPYDTKREPGRVVLFNGEDSFSHVVSHRLESAGADMDLVYTVRQDATERLLIGEKMIEAVNLVKPRLLIIDPLQAFLNSGVSMERRNDIRQVLAPLQRYAEHNRCAVLIVVHTNKRMQAWGRNRISDSADIWDISRALYIMGNTNDEEGTRYISQEKNSYSERIPTTLCRIDKNGLYRVGTTAKSDYDYIHEQTKHAGGRPAVKLQAAETFILDTISECENKCIACKLLDVIAAENDIKDKTLRTAKSNLVKSGQLQRKIVTDGKSKETVYSIAENLS